MIQKWVGLGRIGRDAEIHYLPSGAPVMKFSLAVDDSYMRDGNWVDRTYWIPIEVTLPSLVQNYTGRLNKGLLIWVEGKVCTYTYQDSNGQTRSGFKVEASSLRIIPERKGQDNGQGGYQAPPTGGGYQPPQNQTPPPGNVPPQTPPTSGNNDIPF